MERRVELLSLSDKTCFYETALSPPSQKVFSELEKPIEDSLPRSL